LLNSVVVGKFTDLDVNANTGDYTVTQITWGDGSSSPGSVTHLSGDPSNVFAIVGSHIYAEIGGYTILGTVFDTDGGPTTGRVNTTTTGNASIVDAPLSVNPFPLTLTGVEGAVLNLGGTNVPVAFFHDNNTFSATPADYVITINWGDGTTSAGVAQTAGSGNWIVKNVGSHAYAEEGSYTVSTTIQDVDGAPAITAAISAVISDAPLANGVGNTINLPPGTFSVTPVNNLGTFQDLGGALGSSADDYKVVIQWGDFSATDTTTGSVTRLGDGVYSVFGTHTFPSVAGTYKVKVTVVDTDGGPVSIDGSGNPIIPAGRGNVTFTATVTTDVPPVGFSMAKTAPVVIPLTGSGSTSQATVGTSNKTTDAAIHAVATTYLPVRNATGVLIGIVGKKDGSMID
jgi:hypothetical protein